MKNLVTISSIIILLFINCSQKDNFSENDLNPSELKSCTFKYEKITGIGHETGCTRRDPSDVIKVGDTYYVWYTKVFGHFSGYWGSIWYATSTDEGYNWIEQGEALGLGETGAFDSQATFTPNILVANGKYYLYYTGVKPTPGRTDGKFENNSTNDFTAIGVAVSESPDGPFKRILNEPIVAVSKEADKFDSYRVDDAALLFRENKYWLYYKGRSMMHGKTGPRHTQMGVAFSENPEGPFKKLNKPILEDSHEVLIWPHRIGVAVLASKSSTIEYAADGLDFTSNRLATKVDNRPNAPGAFRPDLTNFIEYGDGINWGISMIHNKVECYLIRFECDLAMLK